MILERPDPATTEAFRGVQYVEVTDEARMERGEPGVMVSLQRTFVENDSLYAENDLPAFGEGVTVRRWDSTASKIKSGNTNLGSDMIVCFGNTQAFYRSGDYWLIPVRAGIILDWMGGSPQSPHGTEHHYAALALISKQGDQLALVDNLQTKFQPLISGNVSKMGDTINGDLCVLGQVGIGTTTPGQAYKLDINGNMNTSGYAMIQSTKTDVVTASGAGDLTVLLGHFEVGSSIKIEFQAKGAYAQLGAEYVLNGPWSGLPTVSILADREIGGRLTFHAKKDADQGYSGIWLAATWINNSPQEDQENTLRFRITSSADFDTAYTVPFSDEYIQLTTYGLVNINGKVGIGTTSPNAQLQIARSVTVGPFTRAAPEDESIGRLEVTGGQAQIGFTRQSLPARPQSFVAGDQYWWYNPDGTARLWTDGKGDLLTITKDGKLGIGTTIPGAKLEIVGSDDGHSDVIVKGRLRSNSNHGGGLYVDGENCYVGSDKQNGIGFTTDGKWRLNVVRDGNVGIGTNNPEAKLHIEIKADDTNTNLLEVRKNSYKYLSIENNGDVVVGHVSGTKLEVLRDAHMMGWVGIGTTEPKGRLHIKAPEAGQVPLMVETPAGDLSDLTARYAFFKGQLEQPAIPNGTICLGGVYGDKLVFFFRAPNGVAGVAAMKGGNNLTEVLARLG